MIELILLRTLSVYNTTLGSFLLIRDVLIQGSLLTLAAIALLYFASFFNRTITYALSYTALIALSLISFLFEINGGLRTDIAYTWVLNKSGLDILRIQFLNGMSIAFTFILVALLFLSDPRLSREKGKDLKKHLYAHSKLIGLFRIVIARDKIGDNPDYPIMAKTEKDTHIGRHFNDKIRVKSWPYGIWAVIKLLIGFLVATTSSSFLALRYLVVQNYVDKTGSTWSQLLGRYSNIFFTRLTGTVEVGQGFPINEVVVFEAFKLLEPLITFFCMLWITRLVFALVGEGFTYSLSINDHAVSTKHILVNVFAILALAIVPSLADMPSWVFDMTTPYRVWEIAVLFSLFAALSLAFRFAVKLSSLEALAQRFVDSLSKGTILRRVGIASALLLLIALIFSPALASTVLVEPYMEGKRYQFVWSPAYVPTIAFTEWAYEVDSLQRISPDTIISPSTGILQDVRIFTKEAAKLNMKPSVGVNWMSIDPSDIDIIYANGTEYWVAFPTLTRPPYPGDVDVWRADHLLLTHSEKILMLDASNAEIVNASQIFNLRQTPQLYYGEGGLWQYVDEIYLNIPGFSETHLPEYQGPPAYDGEADYVYRGFWRAWKFGGMWKFDFARGDYGDIQALVTRDINTRLDRILLPEMEREPDSYPVIDDEGNLYMLSWVWISREPPHAFCDYPDHTQNLISRKLAIVLVNLKNGSLTGYLMNQERDDYVLSFYRSFYSDWDKPVPEWIKRQLRYPEEFLKRQIDVYNWYFQNNFEDWQRNEFYELTLGDNGQPIEDVRYILMPINGKTTWCATRLVEWYKGNTRNLAGMYIAPSQEDTEKTFFVDFKGKTIIGPSIALSTVRGNPELTKHPYFPQWQSGNVLMYSLGSQLYYVIPYYKEEATTLLPQMVAVVNAYDQSTGFYVIQNPKDPSEVSLASTYAFQMIGVQTTKETVINGTLLEKHDYVENGNTRWLLNVQLQNGTTIEVTARAETLSSQEVAKIIHLSTGQPLIVVVDENKVITEILDP